MIRRPSISTRTDTLFPYTTLFRSRIALPGIGTATGFDGEAGDPETFFSFTSFATPTTIYRYDVASGEATAWAQPELKFDSATFDVSQHFYTSKDGARVPMFVVKKMGITVPAPTLLFAYAGLQTPLTPTFPPHRIASIE